MGQFLHHTACKDCGSSDACGIYDDGSTHCFSCGNHTFPSVRSRIEVSRVRDVQEKGSGVSLPEDVDPHYFPAKAIDWVNQYDLTVGDLQRHRACWSEAQQRLIFPFIVSGELLAYQGRYFGDGVVGHGNRDNARKVPKWLSRGRIHEFLYILRTVASPLSSLILVEDPVSAIKLHKLGYSASPLFGAQVTPTQRKCLMYSGFHDIIMWLDRDKARDAYKYANQLQQLGFTTRVVVTDNDPKELSAETIKEVIK